jgi:hypothetical protein
MNDMQTQFNKLIDDRRLYNLEGTDGVRKLDDLCADLGYTRGQFIGANPIMNFLADNPGAMRGIVEFIGDWVERNEEWQDNLGLNEEEEEEEEDQ